MPRLDAYDDAEVREFIDGLPRRTTYTEMAEACLARFGTERTWSRTKIATYWAKAHPVRKGKASRFDLDPELAAFVEDHMGRFTLDQILAACRGRFGRERWPSRTSLHRHIQKHLSPIAATHANRRAPQA